MTGPEQRSPDLDEVGAWVRETLPPMTQAQRVDGLQAVTFRLEARRRTGRPRRATLLLFAGVMAGAAALLIARTARHPASSDSHALRYEVEGGAIGDGGYVRSLVATGARLRFSEGTEVHLLPGARGRLGRVDAAGARFAIEQGEAEVSVTPRPSAHWLVDAGPFLISVRGTVFTASWDGTAERLDVDMKKGLVSVEGPVADGAVSVRAGQHLTVNVQRKEVVLHQAQPEAQSPPAGRADPGGEGPGEGPPAPSSVSPSSVSPSSAAAGDGAARVGATARAEEKPRAWAAWLASGELDRVLAAAERRGLKNTLARAPEADLSALADAARYRRRDDIARRALLAERSRFPRSARARDAAFLLGRLEDEDSGAGGGVRALEWYDRYLKEAPAGAFASEALGRKMTATERTRGIDAAREIAREYLRRFPTGTYAQAARAFVDRR